MTRPQTSCPAEVDHDARWRPADRTGPVCGYTFRELTCPKRGAHYCEPRANRVVQFFAQLLVHTKGPSARKAFVLKSWQEHHVIRPMFGEVAWSDQWGRYSRRYRVAHIVVARKNGKSELVAGIFLYLLVGDDEESAEVYGAARDTKQAGKVFEPALRMVQLSPPLSKRLKHIKNARRLVDEKTASHFEIITADALGELGHNPHGFYLDEVLSQRDDSLWTTMRTAAGARTQPLLVCMTTETNDPASFGAGMIDEADRVMTDPQRAPHVFAYVRKAPRTEEELDRLRRFFPGEPDLPVSLDVWDEANWKWPNPALDDFLSREALRQEALEARNEPKKENSFRQFRANQRVQQATRYVPMDLWDACTGAVAPNPDWLRPRLAGRKCWAGLDLSSKLDLTAWALLFADGTVLWRFWAPEAVVPLLDEHTDGAFSGWVRDGWVTATDGDTIDYERVYADIVADHEAFAIAGITYDKWCGEPVRQAVESMTGLEMYESNTTYERMTPPMKEFMVLLKDETLRHGGNPVAWWMADNLEAKSPTDDPDRIRPVKPNRDASGKRIDGMPALFFAIDGRMRPGPAESVYETREVRTL
ncbi:terminase large subunit [Streptomyces sp.]|uniref:terminase large subunit n=1 Tax=Streptomyces sp. TaxID=1931 RepID=UPI002F92B306